ncbi:Vacuolar protein sorting-associated protein [Thalictrum thalictroides]|uniref:Vacuolar protein sorting-associated protein n=1 Tax=Thalictrum thalictroides TaxID=46969 RepID=A0A7J6V8C6_THATH|nr:Vacuolar protein sorting-associated protein [Thalictrum thalictroides]
MEASLASDLLVNYFNIQKVMWEPFIETWNFLLNMTRTLKQSSPLNNSVITDIHLTSTAQLNMNLTELSIEVIIRLKELITKVWGQVGLNDLLGTQRLCCSQTSENVYTRRFAPYILQNETSLPLLFQVYRELFTEDNMEILSEKERNIVYPGSSILIYTDETPEEHDFLFRPPQSTDRLNEKKSCGVAHHMISIQLDGTSGPSSPISMDIVGLSYFEVNFSKALGKEAVEKHENAANCKRKSDDGSKMYTNSEFVVPVVFDVSTLHYRKLIRVYSTVILLNTTSKPVELRFDTPFGVFPKVLGQVYPGQKFPLPLHLAESGRMSWCPLETGFLWSEAQVFSNVLSHETKLGSFRSFVCYPSHPSNDPFRCCLSVQHINLPSSCRSKNGSSVHVNESRRHSVGHGDQSVSALHSITTPTIHYVTLTTPLVIKNNMPKEVSVTIDSGGFARTVFISEVNYACIYHIDSTHDLGLVFHVHGFRPITSMFPCAEAFVAVARFHENKFSQSETLTFYPDASTGSIYVTVEKTMDAFCGAREICIFVPFLLYNCTGLRITVADVGHEREGCIMPPCYHLIEMDQHLGRKHSPILFSSTQDSYATPPFIDSILDASSKKHSILSSESVIHQSGSGRKFINSDSSTRLLHQLVDHDLVFHGASSNNVKRQYFEKGRYETDLVDIESRKVTACMYFPHSSSSASELMVRLSICISKYFTDTKKSSVWSSPFYLVPASVSTCVVVPQANTSGAFIVSVTSNPLAGPFSGRTRAITFQPRYVISNACSKDLSYKQKGTDSVSHLGIGQHSHLHWDDPTRELLVSLVFNEPGWLWSGSFFPDHLGDTQVKMRNYVRGALTTIRVEVQNADVTIRDEKIVGNPNGNSGTLLILLSDDETGFMPYRIDNFSKERLRIYQEKCKTFETTVHSYMSCPYTWDEPCYPRRLVVEVLGERVLGSYTLDDVTTVQIPIYLPSTSEKPGRQLFLSIHADGAVKVLSIMDSSYLPKDTKDLLFVNTSGKRRFDQREEIFADFCERISIHVPFIGVSLINSFPQELLFASANDTRIDLLQSVDQQKISFQISSLQVDNQLHNTPYPVILFVDHDFGGNSASQMKNKDDNTKMKNESVLHIVSEKSHQPMFFLSAVKWRNKDISLAFFEYVILRLAALRVEVEEEVILSLFEFGRSVTSKTQSRALPCLVSTLNPLANDTGSVNEFSVHPPQFDSLDVNRGQLYPLSVSKYLENCRSSPSLPSVVPFEHFWQQLYFLANRKNKIYVEVLDLAPIKLTLSFSSAPWMVRSEDPTSAEYLRPISGTAFQVRIAQHVL